MYRFWDSIIKPVFDILQPKSIVEIGADQGNNTKNILEYCIQQDATLYSIDPLPKFDVSAWQEQYGKRFIIFKSLSLNAICKIDKFDAVLIDGDHNWYTVFNELKLIEKRCQEINQHFPLIILHDIGWPYGRRDLYYNPENIPDVYRKPYAKKGIRIGSPELVDDGGINPHLFNAIYENNLQNGVLSAVEDFIEETDQHFEFVNIPGHHGLGVLIPAQLKECKQELTEYINAFTMPAVVKHVEKIEASRVEAEMKKLEQQSVLRIKEVEVLDLRDRLSKSEQVLVDLREQVTGIKSELDEERMTFCEERKRLEVEGSELRQKMFDKDHELADKARQLLEFKVKVNRQTQDIEMITAWVEQMKAGFSMLLETHRWKMGNALGELQRKMMFKRRQPMVTDSIDIMYRDFQKWKQKYKGQLTATQNQSANNLFEVSSSVGADVISDDIHKLVNWLEQLENDTNRLLQTRRWKIGNAIGYFSSVLHGSANSATAFDHMREIFLEFRNWSPQPGKENNDINKLSRRLEQLEQDYEEMLNSRRWKTGSWFVNLANRLLLRKKTLMVTDHIETIFSSFKGWQERRLCRTSKAWKDDLMSICPVPRFDGKLLNNLPVKLVAFYLPQFHQIPENDAFWGKGFTEWTNVRAAQPQFAGHYQPHIPGELGYYDLRDVKVLHRQVELAKTYGIGAFCFYFYWFNGKKPLELPLQNYLNDPALDLPFCLCWANENWTRRWDGREHEVLIEQKHSPEDDLAFIENVSRYMRDPRYIRINSKPLLLVYRPSLLPSPRETAHRWRKWCRDHGIGEIYLAYTQSFERVDPNIYDFDAAAEFPPNMKAKRFELPNLSKNVTPLVKAFSCEVLDWRTCVEISRNFYEKSPINADYKLFRGVCPSWDNTPRRRNSSRILLNSSPRGYHEWLINAIDYTCHRFYDPDERLVFVNAWNEWGEGAYLEPDERHGYAYLEATRLALAGAVYQPWLKDGPNWTRGYLQGGFPIRNKRPRILLCAHYSGSQVYGGERSFLDILEALRGIGLDVVCVVPETPNHHYVHSVRQLSAGVYILNYRQWSSSPEDEDIINSFIEIIQRHKVDIVYANTIMLREPLTAARRCGVKTVTHAREIITHDEDLARQIGLSPDEIVRQAAARSDYIIANSEATAQCYKKFASVSVIPNIVDLDQLDMSNEVDWAEIRFAMISSNLPKKGLTDFIELARRCEISVPKARFLVIGPINPYVTELKQSVSGNIYFSGYIDTTREAMLKANVILNLSYFRESFGRTVTEAMAARRPVIAYNWGALPELIQDGETGFLVEFRNIDELVDRVRTLCENPELILDMGLRAREFVGRCHSLERFKELLKNFFHGLGYKSAQPICNIDLLQAAPRTTVVIPVYNAYEEFKECINSVAKHTDLNVNSVIIIDDGSTEPRLQELLDSLDGMKGIQVIRNERNIGYTKTCNRGMTLAVPDDVVLLNSDTIVTKRWLNSLRVAAYSNANIGTATPLSDNAGAFSVPIPNQPNPKPDTATHENYARMMRHCCGGCEIPDVPTGNGFCLFIKRALIERIGGFDEEAFPRGYGEENDFCMRAVNVGWRNVIAPAAFVFHHRNASFLGEKERLLTAGMQVITKRYSDYAQQVKVAFGRPAMEALRSAARRAAMGAINPAETWVALLKCANDAAQVELNNGKRRFPVLFNSKEALVPANDPISDKQISRISLTESFEQEFCTWLLSLGIDHVEVESFDDLMFDPREVCGLLGIPVINLNDCSIEV